MVVVDTENVHLVSVPTLTIKNNDGDKKTVMMTNITRPIFRPVVNVNNDPNLRKRTVYFFYKKLLHRWIFPGFVKKLQRFFVVGKETRLVNTNAEYKKNKTRKYGEKEQEKIIKYLMKNYIGKRFVAKLLAKYHIKSKVNWYDMKQHSGTIKKLLYKRIVKYIKQDL